jgi:hypothetical protein
LCIGGLCSHPVTKQTCCTCQWGEKMPVNCNQQWASCSSLKWYISLESHGGMMLTDENQRTQRETCPSATLSTTNPTWTDPSTNLGPCYERPATKHLNHVMADFLTCSEVFGYCSL